MSNRYVGLLNSLGQGEPGGIGLFQMGNAEMTTTGMLNSRVSSGPMVGLDDVFGRSLADAIHLRITERFLGPIIVLSFDSQRSVANRCPLFDQDVPGSYVLELPSTMDSIIYFASSAPDISEEERMQVCRWYCGLQREWACFEHLISSCLAKPIRDLERITALISQWQISVSSFAPDAMPQLLALKRQMNRLSAVAALENLMRVLVGEKPLDLTPAPSRTAPKHLSRLCIVDDEGYDSETVKQLYGMEYQIEGPVGTTAEAMKIINSGQIDVLLCDVGLPRSSGGNPTAVFGLELMRNVLESGKVRLVIAVSRSRQFELPNGVINCCGAAAWNSSELIHQAIWQSYRSSP